MEKQTRLVSWNCANGFAKKQDAFQALAPDLAIICEITQKDSELIENADVQWVGNFGAKGMALMGFNGWSLDRLHESADQHVLTAVASRGEHRLTLVGVWTLPVKSNYIRPIISALDQVSSLLTGDVILAGDFNANPVWKTKPSFEDARTRLLDLGLTSLWHERSGEPHGGESMPTLFWKWNETNPFHIDYIFATEGLRERCCGMTIGTYQEWVGSKISDHVPLIADFDLG
ncbi:endonuclease/exonuclease/phosphatase family protein [Hyphomonas oceanitis]|uniref:endonuclease/exonuclease/phosphatase family protein n=1 Tax=Hyphomonas oceanitis TaxID=81033 RepID=UPI00300315AA